MHPINKISEDVIKIFHNSKESLLPKIEQWIYDYEEKHRSPSKLKDSKMDSPSNHFLEKHHNH